MMLQSAKCPDEVAARLAEAERQCADRGARLTPVRRRTLEILLGARKPLGAYEVLETLAADGYGAQPPVAYRALDFLMLHGLVHKVRELNAFTACTHPEAKHSAAFLICRLCGSVAETFAEPKRGALGRAARAVGFEIERTVVEAEGVCADCRAAAG
jgi:Fur family zinc uptake transcriptional regulator